VQKAFVVLRGLLFVFKENETKRFVLLYFSPSYQGGWWLALCPPTYPNKCEVPSPTFSARHHRPSVRTQTTL